MLETRCSPWAGAVTGASSWLLVLWEGGSGLAQPVLGAQTHLVPGGLLGGMVNLMGAGLGPDFSVPGAFWGPVTHAQVIPLGRTKSHVASVQQPFPAPLVSAP